MYKIYGTLCRFQNIGRRTKSTNPVLVTVTHHRQQPLEPISNAKNGFYVDLFSVRILFCFVLTEYKDLNKPANPAAI